MALVYLVGLVSFNKISLLVEQAENRILYGTVEDPSLIRCREEPRRSRLDLRRNPGRHDRSLILHFKTNGILYGTK